MADEIVVLITTSTADEAAKIAKILVDERLIACANILPGIRSVFFWEGKTQDASEALMLCKTRQSLMAALIDRVRKLHSYTVPEVIALPIVAGSRDYLDWVRNTVKS